MVDEIIIQGQVTGVEDFMPIMSVGQAIQRYNQFGEYVKAVLVESRDYGKIPGTSKNTLLKAGAEKLCSLFGYATRFVLVEREEDWTGEAHGGEPFFYYLYRCQLWRGDRLIAEGDGSCNSWESKYRYRNADRVCPRCGEPAIIENQYDGGWLCYHKKGGCGAKYKSGDKAIENQPIGRIANPNVADLVNTIQKMAQKRALVAGALIGTNASDYFTQDAEDFHSIVVGDDAHAEQAAAAQKKRDGMLARIVELGGDIRHAISLNSEQMLAYGTKLGNDAKAKKAQVVAPPQPTAEAPQALPAPKADSDVAVVTGFLAGDTTTITDKVCKFSLVDDAGEKHSITVFPQRSCWHLVVGGDGKLAISNEDILKVTGKLQTSEKWGDSVIADSIEFVGTVDVE